MNDAIRNLLRQLPSMDELLALPWVPEMEERLGRDAVKGTFSEVVGEWRQAFREGTREALDRESLTEEARARLETRSRRSLRRVLNGTGVVVHTNLGRSLLPPQAVEAVREVALGYSTLEYSLEEGKRGHRNDHVEWLLCQATGAEKALVANNNAAAVLLGLAGLAAGREVIVSRGELVEIGGSFRIPEILSFAGAKMVEVGTTNRTRVEDYAGAVTDQTALLLKVHPSNYRIEGFHQVPAREELAALARERELTFMEDLGSGLLAPPNHPGLEGEPTVRQCLHAGVDLVTFSGDKLLGGPQIGALVGRHALVDRLKRHPLMRAFRVDKMTLAAFEAILRMELRGEGGQIPTSRMLHLEEGELKARASRLAARCRRVLKARNEESWVGVVPVEDAVGGGAFPATPLPGYAVALRLPRIGSAGRIQERFRLGEPPVVLGAEDDLACLHLRTLQREEESLFLKALERVLEGRGR
ncbi:L-seryl-tRNA(Sec) selenium transferase [Aminomonas paucivorans]|uniref:L-seryl-tRNA(Sec) selenium transferase n=1 Tax=Aminomonas paucivorans TaxID=81412 RepID=UPI0033256F2A